MIKLKVNDVIIVKESTNIGIVHEILENSIITVEDEYSEKYKSNKMLLLKEVIKIGEL